MDRADFESHILDEMLRENAILLFDMTGKEVDISHSRHVDGYVPKSFRQSAPTREIVRLELTLAIHLWMDWEILIRKTGYSKPRYSCLCIDMDWIESGAGTPPCVVIDTTAGSLSDQDPRSPIPEMILGIWPDGAMLELDYATLGGYVDEGVEKRGLCLYLK